MTKNAPSEQIRITGCYLNIFSIRDFDNGIFDRPVAKFEINSIDSDTNQRLLDRYKDYIKEYRGRLHHYKDSLHHMEFGFMTDTKQHTDPYSAYSIAKKAKQLVSGYSKKSKALSLDMLKQELK